MKKLVRPSKLLTLTAERFTFLHLPSHHPTGTRNPNPKPPNTGASPSGSSLPQSSLSEPPRSKNNMMKNGSSTNNNAKCGPGPSPPIFSFSSLRVVWQTFFNFWAGQYRISSLCNSDSRKQIVLSDPGGNSRLTASPVPDTGSPPNSSPQLPCPPTQNQSDQHHPYSQPNHTRPKLPNASNTARHWQHVTVLHATGRSKLPSMRPGLRCYWTWRA